MNNHMLGINWAALRLN